MIKIYVIYKHPLDYPMSFVVRLWENDIPKMQPEIVCSTLEEARGAIPPGYINIGREPGDDYVILEAWVHGLPAYTTKCEIV